MLIYNSAHGKLLIFCALVCSCGFHYVATDCGALSNILDLLTISGTGPAGMNAWNKRDYDVLIHTVGLDGDGYNCSQPWANRIGAEFGEKLNISGISFSTSENGNTSAQLTEALKTNRRPLVVVLMFQDTSKLNNLIKSISRLDFEHLHQIMCLIVPVNTFTTRLDALERTKPAIELIGQHFSIAHTAYVFSYHFSNNSESSSKSPSKENRISILIQEAYTIRSTTISHELSKNLSYIVDGSGLGILSLPHEMFPANFLKRRMNFEKAVVIASGHDDPEYPHSTKFKPNSEEFESGFEVNVYRYLRDALNFTEQSMKSNGYMGLTSNGSVKGYALQLSAGTADLGIGMSEFIPYRLQGPHAVNMLMPTTKNAQTAFFKQPPPSAVRNIFIKTFTISVWSSLFGIWILIIGSLKLITSVRRTLYLYNEKDELVAQDVFMWGIGAVAQQGWHTTPDSICVKIVFFFGSLTGLILYIAYSAALVSILSVNMDPVTKFSDLLTYGFDIVSDYRIPTTNQTLFSMEQNHEIPKAVRPVVIDTKVDDLFHSRLAIVSPPDSFYPIASNNYSEVDICTNTDSVLVSRATIKMSPVVKKGSPLRMWFNYVLLVMKDRGALSRLFEFYLKESCVQCLEKSAVYHANLNLGDVFTAFVVLVFGYVLSGTLGMVEMLYFRVTTRKVLAF